MWVALQSDNPVEISFAQHCLNEAGIWNAVLDDASQAFSGLAGVQGRRLIVNDDDARGRACDADRCESCLPDPR